MHQTRAASGRPSSFLRLGGFLAEAFAGFAEEVGGDPPLPLQDRFDVCRFAAGF
jgi:hypothetical protein